MANDPGAAGTGAWIGLELTPEQRELIRVRTGKDAAALYLTLIEIDSGRYTAAATTQSQTSEP